MVKVIFVNRFFYPDHSATSQILSDLAFALAKKGVQIAIVTSRLRYDGQGTLLPQREVLEGVEIHRVRTTAFGRRAMLGRLLDYASFYAAAAVTLARLTQPGDVVVGKTDPPLIALVAHAVARLRSARFVNWIQDLYPETARNLGVAALGGPLGWLLTRLRDASLGNADANVAIGERMAQRLSERGACPKAIHVIPNWVDEERIRPVPPAENALRRTWNLEGKFVVAYSGNLGRAHEYETVLDCAELLREDPGIVFLFIGGGHLATGLARAVRERGLDHLFQFEPYQPYDQLSASLSAGDCHWISLRPEMEGLIVPSKFYGVAAAGRPVLSVADPQGELGRLVEAQECGAAIAVGDSQALADMIRRLRDDPALRERWSANARRQVDGAFSRRAALERWSALVHSLINGELASAGAPARDRA